MSFIRVWSWLMLFVWPIGIPVFTFLFLWRHRHTLNPDVAYEVKDKDNALRHQPRTPRTNGVAPSCMADARGRSEGLSPPSHCGSDWAW